MSDKDSIRSRLRVWRAARPGAAGDEDALLAHPLVRAVMGEIEPELRAILPRETAELAGDPDVLAIPLVAEADVTQLAVVDAVRRGVRLLAVEAPPGTGRRRTIANILAQAAAARRAALLVASPASLERVRREMGARPGSAALTVDERAALERARSALDGCARALHEVHWPLDRSLADVLEELAGLNEVSTLSWRPADPDVLTPEHLGEIEALARRLQEVPAAVREEDFPWRQLTDREDEDAPGEEWHELLGTAIQATEELRQAAEDLARASDAAPPASASEVLRQLDVAALVDSGPALPPHWLKDLDLDAAREEASGWALEAARHGAALRVLRDRFRPELFDLVGDNDLEDMEAAAAEAYHLLGHPPATVLEDRFSLAAFIDAARKALDEWARSGERLAGEVGWTGFVPSLDSTLRLARVARLMHGPDRPPAEWLDRKLCARVEVAIRELDTSYSRYRTARRALLTDYAESAAELDADAMAARFRDRWRGPMRWLRPGYHRDRALLRAHRTDGRAPADPLRDVARIMGFRKQVDLLEPQRRRFHALLGAKDAGPGGSLDPARRALATAREMLDQLKDPAALEGVAAALRDRAAAPEVAGWGAALEDVVLRAGEAMDRAQALPAGRPTGEVTDLRRMPFPRLALWLERTAKAVGDLGARHRTIAALRNPADHAPLGYEEALEIVTDLSSARAFDRRLEEASGHLRGVYGRLFNGPTTDWGAVVDALDRAGELLQRFEGEVPESVFAAAPTEGPPGESPAVRARLERVEDLYRRIQARFDQAHSRRRHPVDERDPWDAVLMSLRSLLRHVDQRQDRVEYARIGATFGTLGLWPLLEELERLGQPPLDSALAVRKAALLGWCAHHQSATPALHEARGARHDALVSEFRALDRRQREASSASLSSSEAEEASLLFGSPDAMPPLSDDRLFDLVVFDETTPLSPEVVLAVLPRASAAVVFGDSRRLPPRDGLLSRVVAAGAPVARLLFHHRRTPDALMAFSNATFYGGALVTIPSPARGTSRGAIRVERVPPGGEAERAAALVDERRGRGGGRVAVVATSERLRASIAAVLAGPGADVSLHDLDAATDEGVATVVLCLDAVEGDPPAAWRLNAAIARAREELVVVTAHDAAERLLGFTAAGRPAGAPPVPPTALSADIGAALGEMGFEVEHAPGGGAEPLSLAVVDPVRADRFLLGIDTDDSAARAAWPARDRDRLRLEALESRGWTIHRVRALDWVTDRARALRRLVEAIRTGIPIAAPPPEPATVDYQPARLSRVDLPPPLSADRNVATLADLFRAVVDAEGPVHQELAARRVLAACGITRQGRKVAGAIGAAVQRALETQLITRDGPFLRGQGGTGAPLPRVPVPGDEETRRAAVHIPPEEIRLGAAVVLRGNPALRERELTAEAARLFGLNRLDAKARAHFREALRGTGPGSA